METKGWGDKKLNPEDLRVEKEHWINDVPGASSGVWEWRETDWKGEAGNYLENYFMSMPNSWAQIDVET